VATAGVLSERGATGTRQAEPESSSRTELWREVGRWLLKGTAWEGGEGGGAVQAVVEAPKRADTLG